MRSVLWKEIVSLALMMSCLAAVLSCDRGSGNIYDNFKKVKDSGDHCSVTVSLDTVSLETINSSGVSISGICSDGSIYYYARYFSWVYKFDTDGNLLGRYLGFGRGPKESGMKQSLCFSESADGEWALFDTTMNFELFDSEFNAIHRFRIPNLKKMEDATSFYAYSIFSMNPVARMYKDNLYINSYGYSHQFNYVETTDRYLNEARHISVVDMQTGEPQQMEVPGFPSVYHEDPYKYAVMEYTYFDIDSKGNFYLDFEADSLVYMFTDKFKPVKAFGRAGKDMDRAYEETRSFREDREAAMRNRFERGYYSYIEYIDETGLCFRSYVKGKHSEYDGLQIYRDGVLIGDCEVPKGFRVTGYVAPYYYSQVYDENDGDKLYVYRFTL